MHHKIVSAFLTAFMFGACIAGARAGDFDQPAKFDIDAQPLDTALLRFSEQAGIQVLVPTVSINGIRTSGIHGEHIAERALSALLQDSGLTYRQINARTIAIRSSDKQTSATQSGLNLARVDSQVEPTQPAESENTQDAKKTNSGSSADAAEDKIQEIIVTAQKRKENLQDVPIAITVLGGEALDSSTFANFNDALRTIPGFDNNIDQATGGITIAARGVSNSKARGSGASTVAYYIDGMPYGFVRNSFLPSGGDVYDLERIEFLAGPQGTLYGANALNGVLRILTNDPEINSFAFKGRVMASATEESGGENYRGDAAVNVPIIKDKLALRVVAGYRNDSGWIDSPVEEDVNFSKSRYYRVKLKLQATETLSLGFSVWHSQLDFGALDLSNDAGRITALQDQFGSQSFTVFGAEIDKEFPVFTVSSSTNHMKFQADGIQSGAPLGFGFLNYTAPTAEVFSQEVNFISTSSGPWRWSAGLFYRDAKDVSYQKSVFFNPPVSETIRDDYTDRSESWAVYGEIGRGFFDDKLNLSAGLRYFHDEQALSLNSQYFVPPLLGGPFVSESEAVTPRLVATWKHTNDVTFYASYSQGFRSGFAQRPEVQRLYPNFTPVEPDKLSNYEVGAKGSLSGGAIRYTASLFYIDWQNVQQTLTFLLPGGQQSTNAGINANSASGLGAEASLSVQMKGLRISGSVSWNDLKFDSNVINNNAVLFRKGDRLILSPDYTIGGEAEYSWNMNSDFVGRISWGGDYKSAQNTIQNGVASTSQSIFIQRARLVLESPKNWTASLYVDNLNNEKNSPTPRLTNPVEWTPRFRPRTMGLMFDYHY